jgi:hypothetical protein
MYDLCSAIMPNFKPLPLKESDYTGAPGTISARAIAKTHAKTVTPENLAAAGTKKVAPGKDSPPTKKAVAAAAAGKKQAERQEVTAEENKVPEKPAPIAARAKAKNDAKKQPADKAPSKRPAPAPAEAPVVKKPKPRLRRLANSAAATEAVVQADKAAAPSPDDVVPAALKTKVAPAKRAAKPGAPGRRSRRLSGEGIDEVAAAAAKAALAAEESKENKNAVFEEKDNKEATTMPVVDLPDWMLQQQPTSKPVAAPLEPAHPKHVCPCMTLCNVSSSLQPLQTPKYSCKPYTPFTARHPAVCKQLVIIRGGGGKRGGAGRAGVLEAPDKGPCGTRTRSLRNGVPCERRGCKQGTSQGRPPFLFLYYSYCVF